MRALALRILRVFSVSAKDFLYWFIWATGGLWITWILVLAWLKGVLFEL